MMKKLFIFSSVLVFSLSLAPWGAGSLEAQNPLYNKIIALDAGHGGDSLGATYPPDTGIEGKVYEKDVNIATVFALKAMLKGVGAEVVLTRECDEKIPRRKDRVDIAKEKCAKLDLDNDGLDDGRECDVLVSLHHNGNPDETYDGMMVIYNNKEDLVLATYLHDRLLGGETFDGLFKGDTTYDEEYDRGGYGMTVYFTPASLTEGYYVTNKCEAEMFYPGTISDLEKRKCSEITSANGKLIYNFTDETAVLECGNLGDDTYYKLDYDYGVERVNQEAEALYWGLIDYFSTSGDGGNGGGGGKCPPAKQRQGKC